ncbi:hypothetical protein K2173_016690 [Erythroxylum novogranatense]|uniref:Uncharacterized protein n=1 Tax=Erythroxylum novogranatense TaxID=1862640 RepID=A0AAV8SSZ7_9ROSI|nr:hypothetical protein K2173_016690 [Erythroxylum novogranatense]
MKISSKSILSPGRAREPTSQISLSNSLSRRLRSNGSMKGGQASPMFSTANAKKRGCGFENPEPSSPKVTCIGQVRVKTKKQGKKLRKRSTRRGEPSFRRIEQNSNDDDDHNVEASKNPDNSQNHVNHQFLNHQQPRECLPLRNRKWVHFPLTICEALRAFGAEFNCFLPCRSSCMASEKDKDEKAVTDSGNDRSCGAVFTRWLVAVQEADGKGREIELVVGEEDEREESSRYRRSYRRHVFEEIEFKDESFEGGNGTGQEEEARVSICIPPKNALLLMRCRSDPVRMAALANKFWEAPPSKVEEDVTEVDEEVVEDCGNEKNQQKERKVEQGLQHNEEQVLVCEELRSCEPTEDEHQIQEAEKSLVVLESEDGDEEKRPDIELEAVTSAINLEQEVSGSVVPEDNLYDDSLLEKISDTGYLQNDESEEKMLQFQQDWEEQKPKKESQEIEIPVSVELKQEVVQNMQGQEPRQPQTLVHEELELAESSREEKEEAMMTLERSEPEDRQTDVKSRERESEPLLPDCLLLMMCEPKLSMEVSKETWVCSTDFIRWMPEQYRPWVNKNNGGDDPVKRRVSRDSIPPLPANNTLQQPPRSSCSYPSKPPPRVAGAESMATVIGQKLLGDKAYEPFVLTRCKSEPMRSAAKLAPDGCFWKNRKIEPHRPATLGVGAAGVV